ncbi:hypothetical protein GJR96_13895 [Haloferax sp. MBLA0076]|uniref:Uncharacterized protein n=1 Tax=Haloferax litoreum TaxID=2666140 RepID=A0A6A8GKR6_9EURY|nr:MULTISPECIES: hypothetical protein [Haloferax]KAB1194475.1 hypothetical protein Hfx1148_13830 [Haloferax sp. CBA1148]MRX23042.1 hypothetical protein [Haloferax litoreum]
MPSIVPTPSEAAFMFVPLVVLVATSLWISQNAAARGHRFPNLLGAILAFVPVGVVAYLLVFVPNNPRQRPPTTTERWALTVLLAGAGSFLVGSVGLPPDPSSQGFWFVVAYVGLLPLSHLVVYRRGYRHVTRPVARRVSGLRSHE